MVVIIALTSLRNRVRGPPRGAAEVNAARDEAA